MSVEHLSGLIRARFSRPEVSTMTTGYFTEFQLPAWLQDADCLIEPLRRAWQGKYLHFRAEGATEGCERACDEVLAAFGPPTSVKAHRRLVYMCWAMAKAASGILHLECPGDRIWEFVDEIFHNWARSGEGESPPVQEEVIEGLDTGVSTQEVDEAVMVLQHALRALDVDHALPSAREILDLCFDGYAIIPGGEPQDRRDLLNWWLVQVAPAAFSLRLPEAIYSVNWPWPPDPANRPF